jgi:molecular chaperone GrpE (heat shock protein)
VLQKGYKLGDLVLRPARVVISQGVQEQRSDA